MLPYQSGNPGLSRLPFGNTPQVSSPDCFSSLLWYMLYAFDYFPECWGININLIYQFLSLILFWYILFFYYLKIRKIYLYYDWHFFYIIFFTFYFSTQFPVFVYNLVLSANKTYIKILLFFPFDIRILSKHVYWQWILQVTVF